MKYTALSTCLIDGPEHRRWKWMQKYGARVRRSGSIKPYTWSIGYNNCVGRCSTGNRYGKFSGSSMNRWKQLKIQDYEKDLVTLDADLVAMGAKVAAKMRAKYGEDLRPPTLRPGEKEDRTAPTLRNLVHNAIMFQDQQSIEEYREWISRALGRDVQPISFGIHMLSPRSRGKIKDKATAFYRASPGSRTFVTLTFIAAVDDRAGIAVLNKFLTVIKQRMTNVQYLWVAERQENGNIHFHMIINKRLPVKQFNALWVLQQYNAGLTGKTKYGESISRREIEDRYENGTVGKVLNPFDVKKIRSIGGLSGYLTKYITKQEKNKPFGCSVWHCSRTVSRLFTRATVQPSAFAYLQTFNNYRVDKRTGECFPAEVVKGAYFVMVYVNNKAAPLRYLREMEQVNKWILEGHTLDRLPELDDDDYRKRYLCETE
jgi:hypothetical protein